MSAARAYGFIVPCAVLCCAIALAGCKTGNVNAASSAPPQTATVTRRTIVGQIPLAAQIVVPPNARADIAAPFTGQVAKVDVSVGSTVSRGDTLVELAVPNAQEYHRQALLNLQQAESDYANARKQYAPSVDSARRQLQTAQRALQAARAAAGQVSGATSGLAPDGGAAGTAATGAAAASNNAAGGSTYSNSASGTPDAAAAQQQVTTAQQNLQQAQADAQQNLEPYLQRIADARAAVQQAHVDLRQGYVRSPIGGTVTALNAQPGQTAQANRGQTLATVIDLSALSVQAPMTPQQASFVKPGMEATVTADELPGKSFRGRVLHLTTVSNGQQFVAIVELRNAKQAVRPGMHVRVGVDTGQVAHDALAVPATGVISGPNGQTAVLVQSGGKWVRSPVVTGISDGQFTQIKSGVSEGETVRANP